jgi:hypothetical protein
LLKSNEIEAANRGEATALLIRSGWRVYRPEADCDGEDLIVRRLNGCQHTLLLVQLKSRVTVNWKKYGKRGLWMLFPDGPHKPTGRSWFLIPHDSLYVLVNEHYTVAKHGRWSSGTVSRALRCALEAAKAEVRSRI